MKFRAAVPLLVVLLWAGGLGAYASHKGREQRTLAEYLSSLKEPSAATVAGKTIGSLWSDNAGIGQLAADYKAGQAERFDHRQDFRADDRQPDRNGECATFPERQLRDHRFAGRSEDQGRFQSVLAQLRVISSKAKGRHPRTPRYRARFRGRWSPFSPADPWWWRRATRSWRTTSIRTLPCGASCGPGTSLRTTAFSLRK